MKRKILTAAAMIVAALILLTSLTSCLAFPGASAYDVAVKNGFTGTETEWLASLKGADGANGEYAGRGESAYEIAVANGFSGTQAEWLASLKGASSSGESVSSATSKAITSGVAVIASYKYTEYRTAKTGGSAGSGVIVKDTGSEVYIVTNYHVVYGEKAVTPDKIAETIWVYFYGARYPSVWEYAITGAADKLDAVSATYVGGSIGNDIAVLKLSGASYKKYKEFGATVAEISSSSSVVAGDTAIAIGNPEGNGPSVTAGIVSVDSEYITVSIKTGVNTSLRVMRIDTAVNSGNSGGGLFDAEGRLIGIVNAKTSDEKIENISYAIPVDNAISVASSIIANQGTAFGGKATKLTVGVTVETTASRAETMEYGTYEVIAAANEDGYEIAERTTYRTVIVNEITVVEISSGSLAETLGIQVGDVLKTASIGGKDYPINRQFTLGDALYNVRAGQRLVLTVERNGETKSLVSDTITANMLYTVD